MKIKVKIEGYTTSKRCCQNHKSLIEVQMATSILGKEYFARCTDCGNSIQGYRNVKNLLVTTNPIITPYLLNKANQN
jgi:hypothetical protein